MELENLGFLFDHENYLMETDGHSVQSDRFDGLFGKIMLNDQKKTHQLHRAADGGNTTLHLV
jgi:hypothetical protein